MTIINILYLYFITMNIKSFIILASALATSSLFADNLGVSSSDTYDIATKDKIADVYAKEGVSDVNITVSADHIYYLFAGYNKNTSTPESVQKNANYTLSGGATIARKGESMIIGIRNTAGSSATFTVKDGTYNLGCQNGLYYLEIMASSESSEKDTQKLIFDKTANVNVFSSDLKFGTNVGTITEINGKLNVYAVQLPSLTKDVVVPTDAPYGKLTSYNSGKIVVGSSAEINADNLYVVNSKWTVNGKLNLKTTSLTNAVNLTGNADVTFNSGSYLNIENDKRILLQGNSKLTINDGATVEAQYVRFGDQTGGQGAKLVLNGENVLVTPKGYGKSSLLIVAGYKADISVAKTNSFASTSLSTNTAILLDLQFTGENDYIDFGNIYGAGVETDAIFKVKNFENNRIMGVIGSKITATQLWLYDATKGDYYQLNSDEFAWVSNGNGSYWLNLTTVPEPAEWAMIFGGIALALAIYRRRK